MKSLAIKNKVFRELNYESLIDEIKRKVLPLLISIVMKRNGIIKSRDIANRSF